MDFTFNDEQALLRDSAERFLREKFDFARRATLLSADVGPEGPGLWSEISALGWPALGLPEAVGGMDGTIVEQAILMQELGRSMYVGPYLSTAVTCAALLRDVATPRADELLERVAEGALRLALAHGEPGGRGFLDAPATRATPAGEGRVTLDGRKRLVYDAAFAGMFIVTATGPDGTVLCLVDPDATGIARRDYRTLDNGHASDLELDGVAGEVLATGAGADAALDTALYATLTALGAEAIGVSEGALGHTRDYVAGRKQFGQAIGDFQTVQHQISDLFVEIEQLKALLLHALSCADAEAGERRQAAIGFKILAGHVSMKVAGTGLHLHGGMGMTDEMPISHFYRRARVLESQFGNGNYYTRIYARSLS